MYLAPRNINVLWKLYFSERDSTTNGTSRIVTTMVMESMLS